MLSSVDRESKISLISLSISKILPLNLSRELSTLSSLVLRSDKSSINEDIVGTISRVSGLDLETFSRSYSGRLK